LLRVVVAEDTFLAREGIVRVLESIDGVEVVGVCTDLDDLRATVEHSTPDVVVTDIRMPPTNTDEGLRAADEFRKTHPRLAVIVLSQHAEPVYATALFSHGADGRGYLLKDRLRDRDEIARALGHVAAGGSIVDPLIVERLLMSHPAGDGLDGLSDREREILGLIAEGRSNAWIAERVGISKRGVERHINALFSKLGLAESTDVSRRVAAALMYLGRWP
jgi:DNA-binding NarL/FixJ family response regulator